VFLIHGYSFLTMINQNDTPPAYSCQELVAHLRRITLCRTRPIQQETETETTLTAKDPGGSQTRVVHSGSVPSLRIAR
jgi:hypothetical protein